MHKVSSVYSIESFSTIDLNNSFLFTVVDLSSFVIFVSVSISISLNLNFVFMWNGVSTYYLLLDCSAIHSGYVYFILRNFIESFFVLCHTYSSLNWWLNDWMRPSRLVFGVHIQYIQYIHFNTFHTNKIRIVKYWVSQRYPGTCHTILL